MNLLIVDDEDAFRRHITKALSRRGYSVTSVAGGEEAITIARRIPFDVAIVDMKMPGMDGLQVIRELKGIQPFLVGIVLTGYGSIPNAVDAIKAGAYNYITKPCSVQEIEMLLRTACLTPSHKKGEAYHGIVGNTLSIQQVIKTIQRVKDSNLPVLVCGESGTGKELVARAIHFDGARKGRPFIAINCASLKPELLESELFGHLKGAFTGAITSKDGLLKVADGGTLFIDEIADMNLTVQASLLRFLEGGCFRPLGSTTEVKVDVRVIAAINREVEEEVKQGRLRHDLYYRLNVCRINTPPLRERKEDIPILVRYFFTAFPPIKERSTTISKDGMDVLMSYHWPGNVRELFNVLNRAIILSDGSVITGQLILPLLQDRALDEYPDPTQIKSLEKSHIAENLMRQGWNISRTARVLGMDRRTLQRKIARYGIRKDI